MFIWSLILIIVSDARNLEFGSLTRKQIYKRNCQKRHRI